METARAGVLDDSKVAAHSYTGATVALRETSGAALSRIMHPPSQRIEPHRHDWPVLAIYRLGGYCEETEAAANTFDGPSVVFHPAGADHADQVSAAGLETVSMSFDRAWLDTETRALLPHKSWSRAGGVAAHAARKLACAWLQPCTTEADLRAATSRFFREALAAPSPRRPSWIDDVETSIEMQQASAPDLHPAWVARAYRAWRGEGLVETTRRRRVERAVQMLRASAETLAAVAADAGFCDQSHMNRSFHAVLGRTPLEVRREASLLAVVA
jgi:AraC family transcriptional regulator